MVRGGAPAMLRAFRPINYGHWFRPCWRINRRRARQGRIAACGVPTASQPDADRESLTGLRPSFSPRSVSTRTGQKRERPSPISWRSAANLPKLKPNTKQH